jgi:hypothetical protein
MSLIATATTHASNILTGIAIRQDCRIASARTSVLD